MREFIGWLQFGHGTSAVETPIQNVTDKRNFESGFNSATAHRPWRRDRVATSWQIAGQLQFGHGTSAVETTSDEAGDGDRSTGLQFGHGTSAVETSSWQPSATIRCLELQFGHGTSAVETIDQPDTLPRRAVVCFNSATAHRPWRRSLQVASVSGPCTGGASIRPRHIGRGDLIDVPADSRWTVRELQFGHGTSAVETLNVLART